MSPWQVLIVLVLWGIPILAGVYVGKRKGRMAAGLWLTIILGVIGLVILAFLPRSGPPKDAAAEPAEEPLTAVGSIQPQWDASAAQTDSWIWR